MRQFAGQVLFLAEFAAGLLSKQGFISRAVAQCGGWQRVCESEEKWLKRDFIAAWKAMAKMVNATNKTVDNASQ